RPWASPSLSTPTASQPSSTASNALNCSERGPSSPVASCQSPPGGRTHPRTSVHPCCSPTSATPSSTVVPSVPVCIALIVRSLPCRGSHEVRASEPESSPYADSCGPVLQP